MILLALAGGLLFFLYPTTLRSLYPACPFRTLTGWQCPGCGALRALEALMHGRVSEALAWNAWLLLALPAMAAFGVPTIYSALRHDRWAAASWAWRIAAPVLGAGLVFGIVRNLV